MSKKCMVIPTEVLLEKHFSGFVPKSFHDYLLIINNPEHQKFLDRFETSIVQHIHAENDPSYQQVVPYAIVMHNNRIFLYERAPKGVNSEERLASKLSIGIGGHVEPFDDSEDESIIISTLKREIQEELGYFEELFIRHKGYIKFSETEVDSVHFGLVYVAEIKEHSFTFNNKEIVHGEFKALEEIRSPEIYNRLENWSKVLVDNIHSIL